MFLGVPILFIAIYIVVAIVYIKVPRYLKLVIFAINLFIPDPIPMMDELFMALMFFKDNGLVK